MVIHWSEIGDLESGIRRTVLQPTADRDRGRRETRGREEEEDRTALCLFRTEIVRPVEYILEHRQIDVRTYVSN